MEANNKLNKTVLDLIIKQAKKSEINAFEKHSRVKDIENIGVFTLSDKRQIKVVRFENGFVQIRKFDKNKFKGFAITPVMTEEEVNEVFEFLVNDVK